MPFTKARFEAFMPHTDATEYVIQPTIISGTTGWSKVAGGDYALTLGNSITADLVYKMPAIIRTGEPHLEDTLQAADTYNPAYEQYNAPLAPYSVPGIVAGKTQTVLTGVNLQSVDFIYLVAGAALTTNTCAIYAKEDANNAAPTITTLLASAANGLATAVQTDRYVTNVALSTATPGVASRSGFIVTPDTVITVEWDLVTPSGGTADIFGVCFNFQFSYT